MAKRKRLTPPAPQDVAQRAPETKGMFTDAPTGLVPSSVRTRLAGKPAPIADMAGASAATAALKEVSTELANARLEGRLVAKLALDQIDASHLMRDRIMIDDDDMNTLIASLRARGQQTPIEVLETRAGYYGLISGWRRLAALRRLYDETEDTRFATVHALIRNPASAQDAYLAMIEENEVRVGLSYYERAQIVVRTVQAGVYPNTKRALQTLFANASRAKRSKIKSFVPIVEALGAVLQFPTAITERVGLELSQKLADEGFAKALCANIEKADVESIEAEQSLILSALAGDQATSTPPFEKPATTQPRGASEPELLAPDLHMIHTGSTLKLTGKAVTPALADRIRALLQTL
jgi:ParB family chromosome partitioning protein